MRHKPTEFAEQNRVRSGRLRSTPAFGNNGAFEFEFRNRLLKVIISDGHRWDHVSVSTPNRCPNWEEMSWIKDIFFEPEETVIQIHPPQSDYINNQPCTLHMWRPQDAVVPTPPSWMIGFKELNVEAK
jgi:hypothetical protein